MTTPVLESLHGLFPEATIDIVADKRSAILFSQCPYRGEVLLKDKKKFLRGSVELLGRARKTVYDLIVDLRTDGLAYLCRGHRRYTKWGRRPYGAHAVEQLIDTDLQAVVFVDQCIADQYARHARVFLGKYQ